jgi:CRISPR/Cas system CSM-associated protein Csm3 (group 7 of RAMP superfamily)
MEQRLRTLEMAVRDEDGGVEHEEIPVVSGNSLRGQLRDLLAKDFLDELDVEIHDTLSNALYSGGTLQRGTGNRSIKRRMIQNIRENIPMLSLLGTAIGTQMIEGKLNMGMLVPIAAETTTYTGVESDTSVFEFADETFYTRMDDREGQINRDEDEQAQQMRYVVQVLVPGTEFHHWMTLEHCSEIEEAVLYRSFELFERSPHIGGMKGKGHGKVEFAYEDGLGSSDPYTERLAENREQIREFVLDLDETLEN